jgi:hypothetical protein
MHNLYTRYALTYKPHVHGHEHVIKVSQITRVCTYLSLVNYQSRWLHVPPSRGQAFIKQASDC